MKAYGKSAVRLFGKHIVRLITIIAIVLVSIGITAGIGETESRIKTAATNYYKSHNVSDLYCKCARITTFPDGTAINAFTKEERNYFIERYGAENVRESFSYEVPVSDADGTITEITRICTYTSLQDNINKIELLSGRLPQSDTEVLAERGTQQFRAYDVGSTVTVAGTEYTVCGIILHPLLLEETMEPSFTDPDISVNAVLYRYTDALPFVNDIYVKIADRNVFRAFSTSYTRYMEKEQAAVTAALGAENVQALDLRQNAGLYAIVAYAEKVGLIGLIFVVFFMLVALLVVYSTMSRLFDEERGQIACMKTLGYGNFGITSKYNLFVITGVLIGCLLGLPVSMGLTYIIYAAFHMQYAMPPYPPIAFPVYYLMTCLALFTAITLLSFFTGMQTARHKPVTLLAHKTPKAGKKVILERIGFIWNRLSFKYKSTMRNVLLFKSRFFMTVISVIGSTVLMLAGFGLLDCTLKADNASSILAIAAALIVFSAVLCALVIYNLTNINVSERNREIATLMVLGYQDREVTGYIFREIYIMCTIGAVLGVPCGLGFLAFVFDFISFGALADINWWTWILSPAVTMFFAFLSTLLLRRKITRTDMNASLKILE